MINQITKDAEAHMQKAVESLKTEFTKMRTGRAHPGLLEHIKVDYYGTDTALNHVATVTVSDARTLVITPWEKTLVKPIEKAILAADLGLNPISDANLVRVPLPPLTEERRKDLVRVVKNSGEQSKVVVRNIRRDANNHLKDLLKKKEINEDDERRGQETIQKLTDKFIDEIDKAVTAKEADVMAV